MRNVAFLHLDDERIRLLRDGWLAKADQFEQEYIEKKHIMYRRDAGVCRAQARRYQLEMDARGISDEAAAE